MPTQGPVPPGPGGPGSVPPVIPSTVPAMGGEVPLPSYGGPIHGVPPQGVPHHGVPLQGVPMHGVPPGHGGPQMDHGGPPPHFGRPHSSTSQLPGQVYQDSYVNFLNQPAAANPGTG